MYLTANSSVTAFHSEELDQSSAAPVATSAPAAAARTNPSLPQRLANAYRARSRADRIMWTTLAVVCALMAEVALAAGTCCITRDLMDAGSGNWLRNTHIAVDAMQAVAAVLLVLDVAVAGLWLKRRLRRSGR
ncbi:MAG: hypothetical protein ABSH22_07895 [Tepidisphaeraceae bacterium]|jgi:hypothetical protein